MTRHVTLKEFTDQWPQLIDQVSNGDEIVINRDGKPLARVVPEKVVRQPRKPGSAKGLITVAGDFNDPLPEDVIEDFDR